MSLANFSFPFQLAATSSYAFPGNPQSAIGNLRLNAVLPPTPAPSLNNDERRFNNEPYITPAQYQQQHQQQQQRQREQQLRAQESYPGNQHQHHHADVPTLTNPNHDTRYANYNQDFRRTQPRQQQISQQQQNIPLPSPTIGKQQSRTQPRLSVHQEHERVGQDPPENIRNNEDSRDTGPERYPGRPDDGYTRVNGGAYGSADAKTSVHAILDYDDDEDGNVEDYYDDDDDEDVTDMPKNPRVTPIQGPIYVKNGSVPVVPLYSYPQFNNGSFVQIPILWTALSVALGVELRGDLVKGTPCIKRHHQLYCPTAGKTYPTDRIEQFIDENKALMKRMYGVFEMDNDYGPPSHQPGKRKRRNAKKHDLPDGGPSLRDIDDDDEGHFVEAGESYFSKVRKTRQSNVNTGGNDSGRIDACESKAEIVTPYWAKNSAAKTRAIVNTQHFEQAIHQEMCTKTRTNRCHGDCGCEQKYKWHRLLAYDPDDDCKGIFMDWFIFPSCCVCRCEPTNAATRIFPPKTSRN